MAGVRAQANSATNQPPLFRPAVAAHKSERLARVIAWQPAGRRWAAGLLLGLLCAVSVAVARVEIAQKITLSGLVTHKVQPLVVASPVDGVVLDAHVAQGERVLAERTMIRISTAVVDGAGQSQAAYERARLLARLAGLEEELQAIAEVMARHATNRIREEHRMHAATAAQSRQLGLARSKEQFLVAQLSRVQQLVASGHLSRSDLDRAESTMLAERLSLANLLERQANAEAQSTRLIDQEYLAASRLQVERARVRQSITETREAIRQLRTRDVVTVVAPVAGQVDDLVASSGQRIVRGQRLAFLVPEANGEQIEVFLDSNAAGRVRPGMAVRIRYSGYPLHEFGSGAGQVSSVSNVSRIVEGGPVYVAKVDVISRPEEIDQIRSGMMVGVDVVLNSQSLWARGSASLVEMFSRLGAADLQNHPVSRRSDRQSVRLDDMAREDHQSYAL